MAKKYGESHEIARRNKFNEMGDDIRCAIDQQPAEKWEIDMHHNNTKVHGGIDHECNYAPIRREYHRRLHEAANVDNPKLIGERVYLNNAMNKHMLNPERYPQIHQRIKEVDNILIDQYVENLLTRTQGEFRERVIRVTIITGMKSTRDLNIYYEQEKRQKEIYEKEITKLRYENEMLRKQLGYIE